MKNPFANNSLASFLFGIIIGAGASMGFYAITEPEYPTTPQGQISGFIGIPPVASNNSQQQTVDGNNTQTPSPGLSDVNSTSATNDGDIIHTQWYEGKKYHGLTDNPDGDMIVTPAGKRYHRPSCPNVKGHDFIRATRIDAENADLSPCKKCKP